MGRRSPEWLAQIELSRLLSKWLDDDCSFATAVDVVARSATAGAMRRKRGVVAGLPDNLVLYRGKLIGLELKSPGGRCSASQRATRMVLLRAGIHAWWECRSANAAMWALRRGGVKFREIVNADGTIERWQQPPLAAWEKPRRDPCEPRPQHPEIAAQRRAAARRRYRERKRAQEAARVERRIETEFPTSTRGDSELPTTRCGTPRHRSRPSTAV
jgi:hypothetical protein